MPLRWFTPWHSSPRTPVPRGSFTAFSVRQGFSSKDQLPWGRARRFLNTRNLTCMGTISIESTNLDKIEQITSQIEPSFKGKASIPNASPSILVLLLTSALAQHAASTRLPLQILEQLGDNPTASKPLEVVTAVVDRLPAPGCSSVGKDGLAYYFVTNPGAAPISTQTPLQSSSHKSGSITFSFNRPDGSDAAVQLPLAQTIFSTGLPSTMTHGRFEFDPLEGSLRKSTSKRLETLTVSLEVGSHDSHLHITAPLIPLTPLRRVANSMGNIVRKLSDRTYYEEVLSDKEKHSQVGHSSITVQPASQELETSVDKYFKLNNLSPEAVKVWALIVPQHILQDTTSSNSPSYEVLKLDNLQLQESWNPSRAARNEALSAMAISKGVNNLIQAGGRLCQVLSGGGGWGKKAGLLSLDPDTTYSTRDIRSDIGWNIDFDDLENDRSAIEQQRDALGGPIREGDGVMLFLAKGQKHASSHDQTSSTGRSENASSVIFGAIPSSLDQTTDTLRAGIEPSPQHFPNHFGMLSEGGMALKMYRDEKLITQTKLDVPCQQLLLMDGHGSFDGDL